MTDLENSMFGDDGSSSGVLGKLGAIRDRYNRQFQIFADKVAPYVKARWGAFVALFLVFFVRIFLVEGFYIVAYALGIYDLNIFIHFITPKSDPESDGPVLPQRSDESEFRPFERKLPEFKFWWACVRATLVAFVATGFSAFDVPVYWPILLVYFVVLFALTMKKEITKWYRLGYLPWNAKKPVYQ